MAHPLIVSFVTVNLTPAIHLPHPTTLVVLNGLPLSINSFVTVNLTRLIALPCRASSVDPGNENPAILPKRPYPVRYRFLRPYFSLAC